MGSRISQSSGQTGSETNRNNSFFAVNLYRSFRETVERRRQRSRLGHGQPLVQRKRSSMNRPVLRLQVKSDTLERHRKNMSGLHLISKEKLETLAKESGMYENIFPTSPPPFTRNHSRGQNNFRQSTASRDSMVIIQFVDDGPVNLADGGKHENDYDRLLPRGEFDHLCTLQYGRVNSIVSSSTQVEDSEDHLTTVNIGTRNSQPSRVDESLKMEQLRERIIEHLEPYESDPFFQRSNSMSALSSLRINDNHMRRHQSTGHLESDLGDWSLGESIMRTLSKGNILLFDIENPQHESEKEVNRAWPGLQQKLAKCHQSQESLNNLEHDSDGEMFSDSGRVSTPPISSPSRLCLPRKSSKEHLV